MTVDEFEERLLRFGGRVQTWPPDEARAAACLLAQSEAARALLDETERLEAFLRDGWRDEPPAGLADRILAAALADEPDAGPVDGARLALPLAP